MQKKIEHISFLKAELGENKNEDNVAMPVQVFSNRSLYSNYLESYKKIIKHNIIVTEYDVVNPNYEELFGDKNMFDKVKTDPDKYIKHFLETITKDDKGDMSDPLAIFVADFNKDNNEIFMHCYLHGTTIECDSTCITFKYNKEINKWFFLDGDDFLVMDIIV